MNNILKVNPEAGPTCPICHSSKVLHLCKSEGYDVWRCPNSSTDFVWPLPTPAALKQLYDREAWFQGGEKGGYADYDAQTEPSLAVVTELLSRFKAADKELAVLDIGCGYGNHLQLAADQGWKCFGIEPSEHARAIIKARHGDRITVVERAEDLLPKRFDLVLMFEVIEHLADPYKLLFTLFGRDAIGPETLIVISTPNARSFDAIGNPAGWAYRHPPSHLVFYSAKSLHQLLTRLLFKDIRIRGVVPVQSEFSARFDDEVPSLNDAHSGYLGVLAEATGSTFKEFMHERYVPDTFWKLTEYEHFPRYALAAQMAQGTRVLDFGCGTGYGTAKLGKVADTVLGIDISEEAIRWAREAHHNPKLSFDIRADLGRGLDQASFDLVTCFEMIEHVDHATQVATIRSISRLLTPSGKLVISTPDPAFTAPYGPNPYHLREMSEIEFLELLSSDFKFVTMLKQWVRPSVVIAKNALSSAEQVDFARLDAQDTGDAPIGFVAICSNEPFDPPPYWCQFDTSADFNQQTLETEHKLNRLRFECYQLKEKNLVTQTALASTAEEKASMQAGRDFFEKENELRKEEIAFIQAHSARLQLELKLLRTDANDTKTWLSSQSDAWERLAKEREQTALQQSAELQTLHDAKEWLASQRDQWATLANVREEQRSALQIQYERINSQYERLSNHKAVRVLNYLMRGKLF